jgi:uncharacterized protein YbjT (DUF2867 family)
MILDQRGLNSNPKNLIYMKLQNVLVAGATGTTGNKIIDLLKSSNHYNPIAMVRKEEQVKDFQSRGIETLHADLENDFDIASAKASHVIFAAGSGGKKVESVDQNGAKRLIDESVKNNIEKFVMLSSMGADNPSSSEELQDYLKAKHNADEHLKNSGLNYTIVRPGALNNEAPKNHIMLKEKLGQEGSIPRADVAQTLVEVLPINLRNNETFEILSGDTSIYQALAGK